MIAKLALKFVGLRDFSQCQPAPLAPNFNSIASHFVFFALIGLILSPLAVVAHAPVSSAESVHSYAPFDYEKWRRDHPRPAGKRLANLNVGEPRTVRMIYFLPNDRPYRQEVVDEMKAMMRRVPTFFAEQMQAHGYGNRTFRIETDAQGEPLVHRVDGRHPDRHYLQHSTPDEVFDEIAPVFDIESNVYLIVIDNSTYYIRLRSGLTAGGIGGPRAKNGGFALVPEDGSFSTVAHELGHAFDLAHDFRDDNIMSYGDDSALRRLSACSAEFLAVHPYFNPNSPIEAGSRPTIEQLTSSIVHTGDVTSIPVRAKVSDSEGLHQVLLLAETKEPHPAAGYYEVKGCRGLAGERDSVVEFDYDGTIPSIIESNFNSFETQSLSIYAINALGNVTYSDEIELVNTRFKGPIYTLGGTGGVDQLSFSPDGRLLASGGASDGTIKLWDVASGKTLATLKHEARSLVFSPDGRLLASGGASDGTIKLWDVASGKTLATLKHEGGEDPGVSSLVFSSDGRLLASGGASDFMIKLWDVASGEHVATFSGHRGTVTSLAFSPNGKQAALLASGASDGTIKLWDVASGKTLATLKYEGGKDIPTFAALVFSPDGRLLASEADDWYNTVVKLWDVATGESIATLSGSAPVSFSPDGRLLASGSEIETIWYPEGGLLSGGQTVILWDVATGESIATLPLILRERTIFSSDGRLLASGSWDKIELWDISEWMRSSEQMITVVEEETTAVDEEETTAVDEEETTDDEQSIPQALTKVSGDGQQGSVGERLAKPFVVSVLDQNGSAFAGAVVTFSVTAGGGTLSATTDTTDANGRATTRLTLGSDEETNTVSATVEGLDPVTFTATAITPHSLTKVSGDGQQGPVSTQLAKPFVVLVLDEEDAAMAGVVVTFTVTAGGGTMSSTTAITSPHGRAARTLTLGDQPGANTVEVSVAGLDPVAFTATAIGEELSLDLSDLFNQSGKLAVLPDRTQLLQNAPNPFNSQTVVSYFLLEPGLVRLEVFALSGQRIAVLHQGPQQAGYHRLHWDGQDAAGRSVASGTYLYRLVTDEVVLTRKLVLLR